MAAGGDHPKDLTEEQVTFLNSVIRKHEERAERIGASANAFVWSGLVLIWLGAGLWSILISCLITGLVWRFVGILQARIYEL